MKQLPPHTIGCKTQVALIFKNVFKAASLSCYIIVKVKLFELLNKQPPYLIQIFLQLHNHLNILLLHAEITKIIYLLWRKGAI